MENNIETLYKLIGAMDEAKVPIAIKGGLLLNTELKKHNSTTSRKTVDIDANWLIKEPDINNMQQEIERAVKSVFPDFSVEVSREFGEKRSAGFAIRTEDGEVFTKMDIDVNKKSKVVPYEFNGIKFNGITVESMLADKIGVLSNKAVFRRTKDLLDVYLLNKYVKYDNKVLTKELSKREIGDFSTLKECKGDIQHAYEKLRDIDNKPEFEEVYSKVLEVCQKKEKQLKAYQRNKGLDK